MTAAIAVALVSGACDADTGQYEVAWRLTRNGLPTDCDTMNVESIEITTVDRASSDTHSVLAPCAAGSATSEDVPFGEHTIRLTAIGGQDEVAGAAEIEGAIPGAQTVALPMFSIRVKEPAFVFLPTWELLYRGQPSSCWPLQAAAVVIVTKPEGEPAYTDIFSCTTLTARVEGIPVGPFTIQARLLDSADRVLAVSDTLAFPATRGEIAREFQLNVQ